MPGNRGRGLDFTVALVEDDRDVSDMYRLGLEMLGFHVMVAHDGAEGVKTGLDPRCSIVVLDLNLPKLDGLRVIDALHRAGVRKPIIVLSNRTEDFPAALSAGGARCLNKYETTPATLGACISDLMYGQALGA